MNKYKIKYIRMYGCKPIYKKLKQRNYFEYFYAFVNVAVHKCGNVIPVLPTFNLLSTTFNFHTKSEFYN